MATKRGPDELLTPHRVRQRFAHLQAELPRFGLLWGVEGSVDRLLDRAEDIHDLQLAVEERRKNQGGDASLEAVLAEVLDVCCAQLLDLEVITSLEEFFAMVTANIRWAQGLASGIFMETCMKLLAARKAYRNSGRRFHTLDRSTGQLIPAIDRFDAALDAEQVTAWLDMFIVPVEGEQADDEMEAGSSPGRIRKAAQRHQKRKMIHRESAPHTPPRLLSLTTNGPGVLGAPRGLRGGLAMVGARTRREAQENMVSPSRPSSQQGDVDAIMGGLGDMAIDEPAGPRRRHQHPPGWPHA